MAISIEAPGVALNQERQWKWIIFVSIIYLWNQCHFSYKSITLRSKTFNNLYCSLSFSRCEIFVNVNDLSFLRPLFVKLIKDAIQSGFVKILRIFDSFLQCIMGAPWRIFPLPIINNLLSEVIALNYLQVTSFTSTHKSLWFHSFL